jgi:hypothetical protein
MDNMTTAVILATTDGELVGWMGLLGFILSWVLIVNLRRVVEVRSREKTRRDVAAYLAAGAIGVDEARLVLGADEGQRRRSRPQQSQVVAAGAPPMACRA